MATHCFIPILGKRIRVTELDSCGRVPTGAYSLATDGFISLTLSSEVEDGTEIITKKADGSLCVNQKSANSFKRFTLEMEMCGVNPNLLSLVTNANAYKDAALDINGITVPEGPINKFFAFELWTGLSGSACAAGAAEASGYLLLPFVTAGTLGDIAVDGENAVTFSLTGAFTKGGNAWGTGPNNVVLTAPSTPAKIPTALDPLDHLLLIDTGLAPPPSACAMAGGVPATGATAGTPGTFTPAGSRAPANIAQMTGITASPTTKWTIGQYVTTLNGASAYWNATAWALGASPGLTADDEGFEAFQKKQAAESAKAAKDAEDEAAKETKK
jgi:hypothetical protein